MTVEHFSLRPGDWGEVSLKIPVLLKGRGFVVLAQPPAPTGENRSTKDLISTITMRLEKDPTPGFITLFPRAPSPVFEIGCSGPVVLATEKGPLSTLREDYGSYNWTFKFVLLCRGSTRESTIHCDLPVAQHNQEARSLISHRTGKRASTTFQLLHAGEDLQLWEAHCNYLRPDQIRLHAMESGLQIAGENMYSDCAPLNRQDLPGSRRRGGSRHVLFSGPAVHLAAVEAPILSESALECAPPKPLFKCIAQFGS